MLTCSFSSGDELGGVNGKLAEVTITTSAGNQLIRQGSSSSNTLPNTYHLEADYIQRYLGELTPIQESQLVQLKNNFAHLQKGKVSILVKAIKIDPAEKCILQSESDLPNCSL